MIRGPEEVRLTTEEEAAMLREGNRDPSALRLLAELDVGSANASAIALYRKPGFEAVGTIPHAMKYQDGSYADFLLMTKSLL